MKNLATPALRAAVGLLTLSLAACGGSSRGSDPKPSATSGSGAPATSAAASAAPRKAIPAAYDNTKGWTIPARTTDGELADPVIAPDTGLVVVLSNPSDNPVASIEARDAKSGAVRWSSKPVTLPQRGTVTTYPQVLVTHKDGKEYVVLARTGVQGADGVNNGGPVTQLAVYDAASSGGEVPPLRDITVPVFAADGYSALRDGGTITVLADQSGGATVDAATGQTNSYDGNSAPLNAPGPCNVSINNCSAHAKIVGQTPVGPLILGNDVFGSTGWSSTSVVPNGGRAVMGPQRLQVYGTPGGDVVAAWPKDAADHAVWALHDGRTGQVLATVECLQGATSTVSDGKVSDDGRYVIVGFVVFDVRAKQGRCLAATGARQAISVSAVDPDGTAYGQANGGAATSVTLATDQATALPAGAAAPDVIGAGVALFRVATPGPILVYPHR
ncbi:hypothetical protein [Yinghuangia seranimata]|uniref:hypothetical protein n=1 Tax=Yinghuangia seranimata TaxID=408067 RepID=UPI00248C18CE|nr:hypothetical protein [Yinghuangia seranimata]MDI2127687.1 hypothetical protein [Yinghuangia seranimata]